MKIKHYMHGFLQFIYNHILFVFMLSVHPPVQMERQEVSLEENTITQREQMPMVKQQEKKRFITPTKVAIGVIALILLAFGAYQLYTITLPSPVDTKMNLNYQKHKEAAGSSSGKETNSQTGSSSSKGSKNSDKPIGISVPAGKDKISSNFGTGSDGGDGEQPSEQDNDGSKRNEKLRKNKMDGSSTQNSDDDQSIEQEDDSGQNQGQNILWPNNGGTNGMPLVGSTRN